MRLPLEILYNILSLIHIRDMPNMCITSTDIAKICRDPGFWKFRLRKRFPFAPEDVNQLGSVPKLYHGGIELPISWIKFIQLIEKGDVSVFRILGKIATTATIGRVWLWRYNSVADMIELVDKAIRRPDDENITLMLGYANFRVDNPNFLDIDNSLVIPGMEDRRYLGSGYIENITRIFNFIMAIYVGQGQAPYRLYLEGRAKKQEIFYNEGTTTSKIVEEIRNCHPGAEVVTFYRYRHIARKNKDPKLGVFRLRVVGHVPIPEQIHFYQIPIGILVKEGDRPFVCLTGKEAVVLGKIQDSPQQ